MNYKKIKCDNYNIHLINNEKYHNISFAVYFADNISKEKLAYHNVLVNILTTASKKYDTRSKIVKKTQDLYSISPYAVTLRCGNLLVTKFSISILNSKYLDKKIIKENILLIKELLLNPLVEDEKFNDKYFDLALNQEIKKTERFKEFFMTYATIKALNLSSDKEENYKISKYIPIDTLKKLTNKGLYKSYKEMLNNSKIDFCISGNLSNEQELIEFIKKEFKFTNKYLLNEVFINHYDKDNEMKIQFEKSDVEQSKLALVIKAYDLTDFERRYVAAIYNGLFGGNSTSFLNSIVREENAISYSTYSYYNRTDNIFIVNGGFSKKNYEIVKNIIYESMDRIAKGKFTQKMLLNAKKSYINDLLNYDESNSSLISFFYGKEIFKGVDIKDRIENIKKVTKEDIINISKKLKIASIYNLESDLW